MKVSLIIIALVGMTHSVHAAGVYWALGDTPKDWYVFPFTPNNGDFITFQHPFDGEVYTDSCQPVDTWGTPNINVDPFNRRIAIFFTAENPGFCVDAFYSGLVGELGRLSPGEWTLSTPLGQNETFYVDALLAGDANRDGAVDVSDFNIWNENRFQTNTTWNTADFNGDGVTDALDFNIWNQHKFTFSSNVVPEPEFFVWLAVVAFVAIHGGVGSGRRVPTRRI